MSAIQSIFGLSRQAFFATHWPDRWLHASAAGAPDRLARLRTGALAEIAGDVSAVTTVAPGQRVEVFDNRVGSPARTVSPREAQAALEAGQTVRLRGIDTRFEDVRALLHQVVAEIAPRHPVRQCFANLFVSPAGWHCVPHFDGHEVIVLNLFGRKTWRFAAPDVVHNACLGFELGSRSPAILQFGVTPSALPRMLPEPVFERTLEPGDALFLPRGTYHETFAPERSLQITFSIVTTTRAEAATQALFRQLIRQPTWRALAEGLGATDPEAVRAASAGLLEGLEGVLAEARTAAGGERFATDLFEALTGPPQPRYRVNPFVELALVADGEGPAELLVTGATEQRISVREAWRPMFRWLMERREPFAIDDVLSVSGLAVGPLRAVLAALASEDVLWCAFGVQE